MIRQQGKIPRDAVIELFLAEGRLQVDLRIIPVLFHVAQMAGSTQGQRAADAKMGEQHLALLVKDGLAVLKQGQRHVFQGQPHHFFAVGVMAHQAHQTGHRLHQGVPGLLCQLVAVAGGAGGGVAHAASGHQHRVGPIFPARGAPHADAPQRRASLFLFGMARVLRHSGGRFRFRRHFFQQQLFRAVMYKFRILCVAEKGLPDFFCLVRHREHPAAAFHLQLHAEVLEQFHSLGGRERPQRGKQKPRVRAHMPQEFLRRAIVGHVAAALASDQNFLAGLIHVLQHRHLMPLPHGGTRRHQSRRTGTYDQHLRHLISSQNA